MRKDKKRCVRSFTEEVEGHLNATDIQSAYQALKKLQYKLASQVSAIHKDSCLISDMNDKRA